MEDSTYAGEEEDRLDGRASPLFDMLMEFEERFADKAIDELDLSDEDAEKLARVFDRIDSKYGPGTGTVYACLLRHIKTRRRFRDLAHKAEAVMASDGSEMLTIQDVYARYDRLKGDA